MRFVLMFMLVSCVRLPDGPRVTRGHVLQAKTNVKVDVLCIGSDPFNGGGGFMSLKQGSGVVVSARHVLTAYHLSTMTVGRDARGQDISVPCPYIVHARVQFEDGRGYAMVVDKESRPLDTMRLQMSSADKWTIDRPVVAEAVVGEPVCAATATPERGWSCGRVEMIATEGDDNIVHTARTMKGNSGGGVYDSLGRLVGIVTSMRVKDRPELGGSATSIRPGWIP